MERELEGAKIIHQDLKRKAFPSEALFKETKVDFEMMELELQKVMLDVDSLVKEEDSIRFQLQAMKIG
jgi:hypothetical protein